MKSRNIACGFFFFFLQYVTFSIAPAESRKLLKEL